MLWLARADVVADFTKRLHLKAGQMRLEGNLT